MSEETRFDFIIAGGGCVVAEHLVREGRALIEREIEIEIDENHVVEMAGQGHRWRNPLWRRADGALAEW